MNIRLTYSIIYHIDFFVNSFFVKFLDIDIWLAKISYYGVFSYSTELANIHYNVTIRSGDSAIPPELAISIHMLGIIIFWWPVSNIDNSLSRLITLKLTEFQHLPTKAA